MPFYEAYMQTSRPGIDDNKETPSIVKKSKMSHGSRAAATFGFFGFIFGTGALVLVLILWIDPRIPAELRKSVGREVNGDSQTGGSSMYAQNKTWLFAVRETWPPYQYINRDGELAGMEMDIVNSVCSAAQKDCKIVYYRDKMCWSAEDATSEALNNRYVDACVGWYQTMTRKLVYDITAPHVKELNSNFYVRKNSTITTITDTLKIGFSPASHSSPSCLQRLSRPVKPEQVVNAKSFDDLAAMLTKGEVTVAFAAEIFAPKGDFKTVGSDFICALSGAGLMHRQDTNLAWFREGFRKIIQDGTYSRICKKTYGGEPVKCIKDPL